MRKHGIIYLVCGKALNSLNYLVIEHSGVDPSNFVDHLFDKFHFGILLLGIDAPILFSNNKPEKIAKGFNEKDISAIAIDSFIWFEYKEVSKLLNKKLFSCEGDALILKTKPPEEGFIVPYLPEPSGFKKDKISSKDAKLLDQLLSDSDIYIHDDFTDCFIVTKNEDAFNLIIEGVNDVRR